MTSAGAESVSDILVRLQSTDPTNVESAVSSRGSGLTPKRVAPVGFSKGGHNAALMEVFRQQAKQADPTISDEVCRHLGMVVDYFFNSFCNAAVSHYLRFPTIQLIFVP